MAPPLRSPPLLADSLVAPPWSFPCSRRTRPLPTAAFAGAARSDRRRSWSARGRGDLRVSASRAEAEYGRPKEDVADDYYSVLGVASARWEKRQAEVLEKVRTRMVIQKNSDTSSSWSEIWGSATRDENNEEEASQRTKRGAAAARWWREYSRRGADSRPPTYRLPEAVGNKD